MALFTDNFAYAFGDLHAANPQWVTNNTGYTVLAGGVAGDTGVNAMSSYQGVTLNNDQTASVVIANAVYRVGPAVRCGASGVNTGYWCRPDGGVCDVYKVVAGAYTPLGTQPSGITWTAGDVLTIRIVGTTLTVYHNGTLISTQTDSSIASGWAGMSADSPNTTVPGASQFSCDNYPPSTFVPQAGAFCVGI